MPKTKTTEVTEATEQKSPMAELMGKIADSLAKTNERLDRLEEVIAKPITSQATSLLENTNVVPPTQPETTSYPIPSDWRSTVDSVLNKDFGIEIGAHAEGPVSTVTIVVPTKYSTAKPDQLAVIGGRDIRPKVITNAGGVNELVEWCKVVYSSFTPEIQAMIVADRSK